MTQDKEMNRHLDILPLYYYGAVMLSGDKRYWDDDKHIDNWYPVFGTYNIERMKQQGILHYFLDVRVYIKIMADMGIINSDIEAQKVKAALTYESFVKRSNVANKVQLIKQQHREWNENPKKKEIEKVIIADINKDALTIN
jgi:hypothetical protein